MPQNPFQGLEVAGQPAEKPRRVYSFTQDVRQFEICPIRYHRYRVQQYTEPPDYHVLLGDVVHRCIHALCSDYLGKGDHPAGVIPSDARVEQHLERQKLALKYQNINLSLQDQLEARRIVHAWNKAVGPELYPRIIETEFPLEEKLEHYDLRGIPDLLLHGKGRNSTKPEIYELKTRHKPKNRDEADQRQLQLYVHLYHQQYGIVPSRAFVYYLRDLDSSQPEGPALRPVVEQELAQRITQRRPEQTIATIEEIEQAHATGEWPKMPTHQPSKELCTGCHLRPGCPAAKSYGLA